MVPAPLLLSACLLMGYGAALNFEFNRTVYPINPGLDFQPHFMKYVSSAPANISRQDPSHWGLLVDMGDQEYGGQIMFGLNGTGMRVSMTTDQDNVSIPEIACMGDIIAMQAKNRRIQTVNNVTEVTAETDTLDFGSWIGMIQYLPKQRWTLRNITYRYTIPIEEWVKRVDTS